MNAVEYRMPGLPADTPARQHGVALVIVLWMLVLLTAVASTLTFSARTAVQAAGNLIALARAEAAADAGIHRAIVELLSHDANPARWQSSGQTYQWEFEEAIVSVSIRDEAAKIDLNSAPPFLLAGLFRAAGAAEQQALTLADAVADWRDPDDLRSLHGAERTDYANAGIPSRPANSPFEAVEELQQVLGMDLDLYRRIRDQVTVYSFQSSVNTAVASRLVLLALPGATTEQVDEFITRRSFMLERGLPVPPFQLVPAMKTTSLYSIQAVAVLEDNMKFACEAVVRLTGNPKRPFIILAWHAARPNTDLEATTDTTHRNGQPR